MDLLAGYGSDEAVSDVEVEAPSAGRAALMDPAAAPRASSAGGRSLLSSLPAPSAGGSQARGLAQAVLFNFVTPSPGLLNQTVCNLPPYHLQVQLFSGLPKPAKRSVKRMVAQFRMPISYGGPPPEAAKAGQEGDEEGDATASKRRRAGSSLGHSLAALLPPPKHGALPGGGQRLDISRKGKADAYDSDDDDIVPGTEDRSGMVEGLHPSYVVAAGGYEQQHQQQQQQAVYDAAPPPSSAMHPSEAYRVAPQGGGVATYFAQQQQQRALTYAQKQAQALAPADPAEALLQQALEAEAARAARHGGPAAASSAGGGIVFKEIKADDVKHMEPGKRAEADAFRNAFGADYEAKLRTEAGAQPSRLARSRHQIGSLYHQAKMAELKDMELRAQGAKHRAEAKRRYGW